MTLRVHEYAITVGVTPVSIEAVQVNTGRFRESFPALVACCTGIE
jgi:hypothetical protein